MPQSLFKILVHTVFSTKNRADLILPEIEKALFGYIHGITENNGSKLIAAGGTANHIHLLVSLGKKVDIPELIGDIKRDSSSWIKQQRMRATVIFIGRKVTGRFPSDNRRLKRLCVTSIDKKSITESRILGKSFGHY